MSKFFRRSIMAALSVAVMSLASMAHASTVYVETQNIGHRKTTDLTTAGFTITDVASPYGVAVVTEPSGNVVITFAPTDFSASADNTGGGHKQEFDGLLKFTLTFNAPTLLTAIINEGGGWSKTGNGILGVVAGGTVKELDDAFQDDIGALNSLPIYHNDDTWDMSVNLGTFQNAYKSYAFSIDNYLLAEAVTSDAFGSASISKRTFTITIPGGGGEPSPTPLPSAAMAGMALLPLIYAARKRLA